MLIQAYDRKPNNIEVSGPQRYDIIACFVSLPARNKRPKLLSTDCSDSQGTRPKTNPKITLFPYHITFQSGSSIKNYESTLFK